MTASWFLTLYTHLSSYNKISLIYPLIFRIGNACPIYYLYRFLCMRLSCQRTCPTLARQGAITMVTQSIIIYIDTRATCNINSQFSSAPLASYQMQFNAWLPQARMQNSVPWTSFSTEANGLEIYFFDIFTNVLRFTCKFFYPGSNGIQ